jgi:calcium/calmodulin-dependent protein kinase kinase 2
VLKVVDFGVSEMFEKDDTRMRIAKTAGSPAFLPPELCQHHGEVSGKAADIWSMGVCLYCLRYGKLPFSGSGAEYQMYMAIKNEDPSFPPDENPRLVDLFKKLMEKNPDRRITMEELRVSYVNLARQNCVVS